MGIFSIAIETWESYNNTSVFNEIKRQQVERNPVLNSFSHLECQ